MRYALLIYGDETRERTEAENQALMQDYEQFTRWLRGTGKIMGGAPLERTDSATTIRVRDQKTVRSDGPCVANKEHLGGFFIVQAADLEDAIAIAEKVPGAKSGSVEVRPIPNWEM